MKLSQAGTLQAEPAIRRSAFFAIKTPAAASPATLRQCLQSLAPLMDGQAVVAAFGASLVAALGAAVPGLREFSALSGPVSGASLWCPPLHAGRLDLRQIGL